jgi:hypothetical protein
VLTAVGSYGCHFEARRLSKGADPSRFHVEVGNVDRLVQFSSGLQEFFREKARVEAEDQAAARLLEPLVRSPFLFRTAEVTRNPKAHTAGAVRYLCTTAHGLHEKLPELSLELTTAPPERNCCASDSGTTTPWPRWTGRRRGLPVRSRRGLPKPARGS